MIHTFSRIFEKGCQKYCYNDLETNCDIYGGMYQWLEMMQYTTTQGAQGLCPPGWYLPTDADWTALTTFLGGESVAGGKMKETGTAHWASPNTGATNSSSFTALPGGTRFDNSSPFFGLGYGGNFWSSTENSPTAWYRALSNSNANASRSSCDKTFGFSVRCLHY